MEVIETRNSVWDVIPDDIIICVFSFLPARSVVQASQVCRRWWRVALDEQLWKALFYQHYRIDRNIPMAPGKTSWRAEFKRLYYHVPEVKSTVIKLHTDQVLHVSFSHNGKMFATSSKDGYIKVWNADYPIQLKYQHDMRQLTWKYTQFSQFNETDTLLLVSGVYFGNHSTAGEIAVFSLQGEFELQARVINKPYDVFGTWYNDSYLLSGNLHITGQLQSCSAIILNKAFQDIESEHESVVMGLFRFENSNASSIRTILVAKCLSKEEDNVCATCDQQVSCSLTNGHHTSDVEIQNSHDHSKESHAQQLENVCKQVQCVDVFENGAMRKKYIELDSESRPLDDINGTILYSQDYRDAENEKPLWVAYSENKGNYSAEETKREGDKSYTSIAMISEGNNFDEASVEMLSEASGGKSDEMSDSKLRNVSSDTSMKNIDGASLSCTCYDCENHCYNGMYVSGSVFGYPLQSDLFFSHDHSHVLNTNVSVQKTSNTNPTSSDTNGNSLQNKIFPDKYLIFTRGSETYTPHQIGIKKIKSLEKVVGDHVQLLPDVEQNLHGLDRDGYDEVDHVIDLHGHIIGLCLSPDHRYLYINSRQWPKNYRIENALYPPPIAQEIDIHVIDLMKMREVGTMHQAHKAYTPNDECFFIFLDVSDEYVASGAEDKHGYIWDRHYGICLQKFPHTDVVNCVAFNPQDPETLVTVSDDCSIVVWRSRNREQQIKCQENSFGNKSQQVLQQLMKVWGTLTSPSK